jgi:hypothetical protein
MIAGDDDQALHDFKNASARYIRELGYWTLLRYARARAGFLNPARRRLLEQRY